MKKIFILIATLFIVLNSNATIIYTDLTPDSVVLMTVDATFGTGSGSGLAALDINNDGTIDYDFRYNISPGFGWFLHISEKNNNQVVKTTYNSTTLTSNPYAYVVDTNAYIGNLSTWSSNEEPLIGDTTDYNFGGQGTKYIGISLDIAGNTHYGWIKVSFDNSIYPKILTITEFAYRDVADVPIAAGQTTGPPPIPEIEVSLFDTINITTSGDTINFDTVNLSATGNRIIKVKNTGTTNLDLSDFLIATGNTADFSYSLNDTIVQPNDSTTFTVSFSPNVAGPRQSLLTFNTNDSDESAFSIVLYGVGGSGTTGPTGDLVVKLAGVVYDDNAAPYDFGTITVGNPVTENFKIFNTGTSDIDIDNIDIGFGASSEFYSPLTGPLTILAGDSITLPITYDPQSNGNHSDGVFIMYGINFDFYNFQLMGEAIGGSDPTGIFLVKDGNIIAEFDNYDFGDVPLGSTFTEDFYIKNTSATSVDIQTVDFGSFGGGNSAFSSTVNAPFSIPAGDSLLLPVSFSPQNLGMDNVFLSIEPDFFSNIDPIQVTMSATGIDAILITAIDVSAQGNATEITTNQGTLQMLVDLLPSTATNTNVAWTVDNNSLATISSTGILQAVANGTVVVTATTTDGSNLSDDYTVELKNQTTGINDLDENAIMVYPTEVNEVLYIKLNDSSLKNSQLAIYNLLGNEIVKFNMIPSKISLGDIAKGLYFIKIKTINNQVLTKKFIKK